MHIMKKIKYILGIIAFILLSVNVADYLMLQRFKSICNQQIELMNKEDSFSDENNNKYERLFKEKERIVSIWNNSIWNFLSFIDK